MEVSAQDGLGGGCVFSQMAVAVMDECSYYST